MTPDSAETCRLLEEIRQGDARALEDLLERYRAPLHQFVAARLDPRLAARFDPSDVVQETQLVLARRMDDYLERRPMPFHLWARKTARERLLDLRTHHRRQRRAVGREAALPDRSSLLLVRPLLSRGPSPSERLQAEEFATQVSAAVAALSDADREVLLLRHAEELPFDEIGALLDIEPAAARKRFGRALLRLQTLLSERGLLE
jgi:RNA polymerase sigma-70 factor (ECF subfamily)